MPERLLDSDKQTFTGIELTQFVNDKRNTSYENLPAAIIGLGSGVVGVAVSNPIALAVAGSIGVALAFDYVVSVIEDAIDDSDLPSTLERMEEGDSLEVTTNFYEYSTYNGNSYTYYSKESYRIV